MRIEEYDPRKHFGASEEYADIVVKHEVGKIQLTDGEAYELCQMIIEYLGDE